MQAEIGADVAILGVDAVGFEEGNATFCEGRTVPWLQDVPEVDAWGALQVDYRDVVVLDADSTVVAYYNLTLHDLADPANYQDLHDILVGTVGR